MRTVTIRGDVRLIDLFELNEEAFCVLTRCKCRTLSDWDRLLEKQQNQWVKMSPAAVLRDLSNFRLDDEVCELAVAVLAAARQEGGAPCPL